MRGKTTRREHPNAYSIWSATRIVLSCWRTGYIIIIYNVYSMSEVQRKEVLRHARAHDDRCCYALFSLKVDDTSPFLLPTSPNLAAPAGEKNESCAVYHGFPVSCFT